jgi:hypothetical protein
VWRSILEVGAGTGLIAVSLADWTPAETFCPRKDGNGLTGLTRSNEVLHSSASNPLRISPMLSTNSASNGVPESNS